MLLIDAPDEKIKCRERAGVIHHTLYLGNFVPNKQVTFIQ
jgi:hypothetical protein